jgi:predicted ribosome quality control (RQC) complex YloA/Tae2 family protein
MTANDDSSEKPPRNASGPLKVTPLNLAELAQMAISLQSLVGAQLQECLQSATEVGLGFYHERDLFWLWFDLNPQRPLIVRVEEKPPARKKVARPLTLFLRSRFLGRRLQSVRADLQRGRVLIFSFHRAASEGTTEPIEIEARLIPHAANIIARDGKASVAEFKPKELPPAPLVGLAEMEVRTWEEIEQAWWQLQNSKMTPKSSAPTEAMQTEAKWKKAIEKKEAALVRMSEELAQKTSGVHRELGEWLKANANLENVPQEWADYVDREKNLAWNIEHAFHRAKENDRKSEGTKARIALVQKEVDDLKRNGPRKFDTGAKEKRAEESLLNRADAKGRRHTIGDLDVYIGKSAGDNLALLRRAQPFDLWLHLRDQPGSHAILRRTRGRNVTDSELREAGTWVIEQSTGKRARELAGEKFDLLIVECRYVRPIKGDKLGRVNYTNDRVMAIRL